MRDFGQVWKLWAISESCVRTASAVGCNAGTTMNNTPAWLASVVRSSHRLALPVVGAMGMALCIGALSPRGSFPSGMPVPMPGGGNPWPDWLFAAVIALCLGAWLLLFVLVARLRRKRRRSDPDAYEETFEPPPVSPAIGALLLVTTTLLVVGAVRALWYGSHGAATFAWTGRQSANSTLAAISPTPSQAVAQSAVTSIALGTIALVAAAAAFAFVWWLHFGGTRWRSTSTSQRSIQTLRRAVDESADALRFGRTPRDAIIASYAGFEHALAAAGLSRAPSHTANEFARNASRQFRLPVDAVRDLAHLFELARFSEHPMDDGDRDAAWRALDAVKAALGKGVSHAQAG